MTHTARTFLAAILFTGSAAHALTCPKPETQGLVGLWESRETSKGGIGHTLEFRQDGTFVEATTVMVNVPYTVSGDRLAVGDESPGVKFRIENDTFLQSNMDGATVKKERVGKAEAGSSPIVGVWRYRHDTGAIAFERYTEDGRLLFRLPLAGSTGCYQIAGVSLSMTKPSRGTVAIPFELHSGELVLKSSGKDPAAYGRETAGPWYDREHLVPL